MGAPPFLGQVAGGDEFGRSAQIAGGVGDGHGDFASGDADQQCSRPIAAMLEGGDGGSGAVLTTGGRTLRTKGFQIIPNDDRLLLLLPGGGGMGDPAERDPALVAADVRAGLVSIENARTRYRVAVSDAGIIDERATEALRTAP